MRPSKSSSVPFVCERCGKAQEALVPNPELSYTKGTKGLFENQILNVEQAATFLKVSPKTVYRYASLGIIKHQKIGNRYRFLRSELVKFLKGEF